MLLITCICVSNVPCQLFLLGTVPFFMIAKIGWNWTQVPAGNVAALSALG